jgi:hypothetical protein
MKSVENSEEATATLANYQIACWVNFDARVMYGQSQGSIRKQYIGSGNRSPHRTGLRS